MSISFYLRCKETKQAVHVAERSSGWFRGADASDVVGAFCLAHEMRDLDVVPSDSFEDFMDFVVWTRGNMDEVFFAMKGRHLVGRT